MVKLESSVKKTDKIEVDMKGKKGITRSFESNLINKEEVYKLLALAECLSIPVLLVGPPGTAKTATVIDYTKGMFDLTDQAQVDHFNNEGVFMLETDEGTKASEIKGVKLTLKVIL